MEKTNLIIITTIFAVALVGFVMMVSETNTGMFNVYGEENKMYPSEEARVQRMLAERKLSGGQEPYGLPLGWDNPTTGQAYITKEGQDPGNLGQVLTTAVGDKKDKEQQFVAKRNGCYVRGVPDLMAPIMGIQRTGNPNSMTRYRCFMDGDLNEQGQKISLISATLTDPLIWGTEYTLCCFPQRN
jgi:hypothetical protein